MSPVDEKPAGEAVTGAAKIRVLVVDDDALVRSALMMMFDGANEAVIVGEATDGDEVAAAVDACHPDVVLMDIRMARMDGLRATELLLARENPPKVIVLTTFDADDQVLRALRVGASGFLLKDTPPAEIVRAVRRVADGEPMLSPSITRQLIARLAELEGAPRTDAAPRAGAAGRGSKAGSAEAGAADRPPELSARARRARALVDALSEREREVALAVGRGLSNAEIAAELYMSVATAKSYVSKLLTKLEVDNRVQIALLIHDAGLDTGSDR